MASTYDTGQYIAEQIDKAIQTASAQIQYMDIDKCTIYLPKLLIKALISYCEPIAPIDSNKLEYRGYKIQNGYEAAIVIAHEDYPFYQKDYLIHKVKLT